MISMVTKRDGRVVPFDESRVHTAIMMAVSNVADESEKESVANTIISDVMIRLSNYDDTYDTITVEEVQDIIVKSMKILGYSNIAKNYTTYRNRRTKIRERKSSLMRDMDKLANASAKDNDSKRENANINGDTAMGTMLKYGTTIAKEYYLSEVIPEEISALHRDGYIHIHDLDFFSLTETCCQIPLSELLAKGFSTGHGYLRSPNSIGTAAALTCIAIQSNQNDQHK